MVHRYFVLSCALACVPSQAPAATYTCVSFDYPPLIQSHRGASPTGLAVAIVEHIFQQMGNTLKVELYPWARSLEMVKHGKADCIFTLFRTPERERFLDYSNESLVSQSIYLYARKDSTVYFNGDLSSLWAARVGTAHKVNYGPKFEQARPFLSVDEAPTIEQNFRKLVLGRVDVVPSNIDTASSTLALPSLKDRAARIVRLPTPVETVSSHIAFSRQKRLDSLRERFDMELHKFVTTQAYRDLLLRYRTDAPDSLQGIAQVQ